MVLKKDLVLYERDEKGELIPQERPLALSERDKKDYPELDGETICIIPITRGELKTMFGLTGKVTDAKPETDKDEDAVLITKYCKNPEFTDEELVNAKPVVVRSIVRTILNESGVKVDDGTGTRKIDKETDEFGKNS